MAGYHNFSKSNNAITAELNGCYPLTTATKELSEWLGITKKAAKELLIANGPSEWHHTSKYYNQTNYYSIWEVIENLADEGDINAQGIISRKKAREDRKKEELMPNGCRVGAFCSVDHQLTQAIKRELRVNLGLSHKVALEMAMTAAKKRYGLRQTPTIK